MGGFHGADVLSAYSPDRQKDRTHLRLVVAALLISAVVFCGGLTASQTLTTYRPAFFFDGEFSSGASLTNGTDGRNMDAREAGTMVQVKKEQGEGTENSREAGDNPGGMVRTGRTCDEGCSERGVCNEEIGRCDCPDGLVGPTCERYAMPACHLLNGTGPPADSAGGGWGNGHLNPVTDGHIPCLFASSCACATQCDDYLLPRENWCFAETEVGTSQPNGSVDSERLFEATQLIVESQEGREVRRPREEPTHEYTSPSHCPLQCSGRGACMKDGDRNWCLCPFQYEGPGCGESRGETLGIECLNNCSGKGECRDGFCKCERSYFGIDCAIYLDARGKLRCPTFGVAKQTPRFHDLIPSRQATWSPDETTRKCPQISSPNHSIHPTLARLQTLNLEKHFQFKPNGRSRLPSLNVDPRSLTPRRPFLWSASPSLYPPPGPEPDPSPPPSPRVYVYELPSYMNHWQMQHAGVIDYKEGWFFWERLLGSEWRTADPEEAHFFYIPLILRNRGRQHDILVAALKYIELTWPKFFHRRNQTDHIVLTNGDWGGCEVSSPWGFRSPLLQNLTMVSLWSHTRNMDLESEPNPCFILGQDIAIPPYSTDNLLVSAPSLDADHIPPVLAPSRTVLVYFKGYNAEDHRTPGKYMYSFGVRQQISRVFRYRENETGFRLQETTRTTFGNFPSSVEQMRISNFCMAPTGWGWSQRNIQGLMLGCIPVIIQPDVVQPYEYDLLDWSEFAVFLSFDDIPRIPEILRAIPPEKVKSLREKGEEVWPRFVLSSPHHNPLQGFDQQVFDKWAPVFAKKDAVASLMEALRLRVERGGWGTDGGTREGRMGRPKGAKLFGQQLE